MSTWTKEQLEQILAERHYPPLLLPRERWLELCRLALPGFDVATVQYGAAPAPPAGPPRLSFQAIEECYPDDDAFEHVPAQAMYEFARAVELAVHAGLPAPLDCVTVRYDTSAAETDDAIRNHWLRTPPAVRAQWKVIHETLIGYRLHHLAEDDGTNGYPLFEALTGNGRPVSEGVNECIYLADAIFNAIRRSANLGAQPVPEPAAAVIAEMKAAAWCEQSDAQAWADRLERAKWPEQFGYEALHANALAVFEGCGQETRDVIEWYRASTQTGVFAPAQDGLAKAIERAARELPPGYVFSIVVERDATRVNLRMPDGSLDPASPFKVQVAEVNGIIDYIVRASKAATENKA